jgi:hypothetical protein
MASGTNIQTVSGIGTNGIYQETVNGATESVRI